MIIQQVEGMVIPLYLLNLPYLNFNRDKVDKYHSGYSEGKDYRLWALSFRCKPEILWQQKQECPLSNNPINPKTYQSP